jgi:chromosomal replication initiation ATPase DnaA
MFDQFCFPMNPLEPSSYDVDPQKVILTISQELNIPIEKITSPIRGKDDIVFVRHLSMTVIRNRTSLSLPKIAMLFNRHYTTVINAIHVMEDYCDTNHPRAKLIQKFLNYTY